jgi:two-component system chemotaxis response regulator CheY
MGAAMDAHAKQIAELLASTRVLIVDDEYYSRKVIRTLLLAIGLSDIHEAEDGPRGLAAITAVIPDVVLLDWEMPGLDGADFMRRVRSPDTFALPNVPIIMLTGHAERSCVLEAVKLGVHEYVLKPVSSTLLRARLVSVLVKPRNIVRVGGYYGPEPRKLSAYRPEIEPYTVEAPQRSSAIVFVTRRDVN